MENHFGDSFTARMLLRASMRKSHDASGIDLSSEHLEKKDILHAMDDKPGQQRDDNSNAAMYSRFNAPTMKIAAEGSSASSTWLTAAIDDLNAQINLLGLQEDQAHNAQGIMQKNNRIYPILANVQFESPGSNSNPMKQENVNSSSPVANPKTPVATCRMAPRTPDLESTRKSLRQGLHGKMISPRVETTISPISVINSPIIQEEDSMEYVNTTLNMPDEVQDFLKNALGHEINNTLKTYRETKETTPDSRFTGNELMSPTRSSFQLKIRRILKRHGTSSNDDCPLSPPTSSTTFNRSAIFYRSLSKRIKKRLQAALHRERPPGVESKSPVALPECKPGPVDKERDEKREQLMREVKIQQSIMNQASKALDVCHSSKEFISSPEEIESQRLLLLADLRKRALLEQLKSFSCPAEPSKVEKNKSIIDFAQIGISKIRLTLRTCLYRQPEPGETQEWFVIVISEGIHVVASSAVSCPINNLTIDFRDFNCILTNLKPTLKITLQIYVLKIITGIIYNHQDKYHINENEKSASCPSPTKFLKKTDRPCPPRRPIMLSSSFAPSGYVELRLHDLTLPPPWPLSAVPADSILLGTIDLSLSCKLNLSINHQGFLTYTDEPGGPSSWNRRWCILKGHTLKFWNYPTDQESKEPLVTIDLLHCVSDQIAPIRRDLCPKPRTLLIETARQKSLIKTDSVMIECHENYTVVKHLLAFDSTRELVDWMTKLNHIISVLREWNIKSPPLPPAPPMVTEL